MPLLDYLRTGVRLIFISSETPRQSFLSSFHLHQQPLKFLAYDSSLRKLDIGHPHGTYPS